MTRCSRDSRYTWVNASYAAWFHTPPDRLVGSSLSDVLGPEGFERIRPYIETVLSGERVEYEMPVEFLGADKRWIHSVYVPTRDRTKPLTDGSPWSQTLRSGRGRRAAA